MPSPLLKTAPVTWLSNPESAHSVHFYPSEHGLITSLTDYFYAGLTSGKTCVAIATTEHFVSLNAALRKRGINIAEAINRQQYIMLDAQDMLNKFMVNDLPDYNKFTMSISRVLSIAQGRGRPVLAFGEMVALLWNKGNSEGLLQLEKFWHELVDENQFSLYCAYPTALFKDNDAHQSLIDKICNCHSLTLTAATAAQPA